MKVLVSREIFGTGKTATRNSPKERQEGRRRYENGGFGTIFSVEVASRGPFAPKTDEKWTIGEKYLDSVHDKNDFLCGHEYLRCGSLCKEVKHHADGLGATLLAQKFAYLNFCW